MCYFLVPLSNIMCLFTETLKNWKIITTSIKTQFLLKMVDSHNKKQTDHAWNNCKNEAAGKKNFQRFRSFSLKWLQRYQEITVPNGIRIENSLDIPGTQKKVLLFDQAWNAQQKMNFRNWNMFGLPMSKLKYWYIDFNFWLPFGWDMND